MASFCRLCVGPINPHKYCLAHAEAAFSESNCGHCADMLLVDLLPLGVTVTTLPGAVTPFPSLFSDESLHPRPQMSCPPSRRLCRLTGHLADKAYTSADKVASALHAMVVLRRHGLVVRFLRGRGG